MNARERAAYNAGIEAVRQAAMVAAVSIEAGGDGREIRHRAAAAALYGLADSARTLILDVTGETAHVVGSQR